MREYYPHACVVLSGSNQPGAERTPLMYDLHKWRLIDEKPEPYKPTSEQIHAIADDSLRRMQLPWGTFDDTPILRLPDSTGRTIRRWYCTRCRQIETTVT